MESVYKCVSALLTQSPGDTVQTGTGKVDPARKCPIYNVSFYLFASALTGKKLSFLYFEKC